MRASTGRTRRPTRRRVLLLPLRVRHILQQLRPLKPRWILRQRRRRLAAPQDILLNRRAVPQLLLALTRVFLPLVGGRGFLAEVDEVVLAIDRRGRSDFVRVSFGSRVVPRELRFATCRDAELGAGGWFLAGQDGGDGEDLFDLFFRGGAVAVSSSVYPCSIFSEPG
jgi:hypothetical protein